MAYGMYDSHLGDFEGTLEKDGFQIERNGDSVIYTVSKAVDMHVHFRQESMMEHVALQTSQDFAGAVPMPNTIPPITDRESLLRYKDEVEAATKGHDFLNLATVFFKAYTYEELEALKPHILGIKLYPTGVTTNSDDGVNLKDPTVHATFAAMEELGIPLMVHGEDPTVRDPFDREKACVPFYKVLCQKYSNLKITMEHITSRELVGLLDDPECQNLHATVTVQHLLFDRADMLGGMMMPHMFCKPILKREEDKTALQKAILCGHTRIMLGTDSAPHPIDKKETNGCAAGCFTAAEALPVLLEFFRKHQALHNLMPFISGNARRLHNLDEKGLPHKIVSFQRGPSEEADETWVTVAGKYPGNVVPLFAGQKIPFKRVT